MNFLFVYGVGLTPQERQDFRKFVRKVSMKRKHNGMGEITYMLDFDGEKHVSHPCRTGETHVVS